MQKATVKCSSANGKKTVCTVPNAKAVVHVRPSVTSKACMHGSTYGKSTDGIWVSQGCAGSFSVCFVKGMFICFHFSFAFKFHIILQ